MWVRTLAKLVYSATRRDGPPEGDFPLFGVAALKRSESVASYASLRHGHLVATLQGGYLSGGYISDRRRLPARRFPSVQRSRA